MARTRADPPAHLHDESLHQMLIQDLWPDKSLYAAVLLFLTGFVGLLTWAVDVTVGVSYAPHVVHFLGWIPSWLVLMLSLVAVGCAVQARRSHSDRWTLLGAACAFLSVGFFGANAVLALVTVEFVRRARREGEMQNAATRCLHPDMWPDKLLAASLLMVIAGTMTVIWGLAVAADLVTYEGYVNGRFFFGATSISVGVLGLMAARTLYVQTAPGFSFAATAAVALPVALWVVGPVLVLAALVLIVMGMREHEFGSGIRRPVAEERSVEDLAALTQKA